MDMGENICSTCDVIQDSLPIVILVWVLILFAFGIISHFSHKK